MYNCFLTETTDPNSSHLKPFSATTSLKLFYNGQMVATGLAVEGLNIHGKEVPMLYQKVAVTSVLEKTKLLFRTSFDTEYINVGEIIAWPLALMRS